MKECSDCKEFKVEGQFRVRKDRQAVHSICRDCENKQNLERYHNRYKLTSHRRKVNYKYVLKRHYDLTPDQFNEMYETISGTCPICEEKISNIFKDINAKEQAVDHCHSTGKVRGLLCRECNSGIGKLKDNTVLLRKAVAYLEKTNN